MDRLLNTKAQIKMEDAGTGTFTGYASTWDNWDRAGERPTRGAFDRSLATFRRDGFIAIGHEWGGLPVATLTDAKEDDTGLFIAAEFHSTPDAQAARTVAAERLARGKSVSLSIGYNVLRDEYTDAGRLLKEIELYEVSLVNVPANPLALVAAVKSEPAIRPPFTVQAAQTETAVRDLLKRVERHAAARRKEGRVLSAANRSKLKDLHTSLADVMALLEELLQAAEPPAKTGPAWRRAHLDFLRLQARAAALRAGDLPR